MDARGEEVNLPTLPQRGTCSISHLWHVQLEECFSTNLSDTELTPSPSSREQDTGGVLPGPGGIGVPLGICPTQPAAQHIPAQLCLCPGHSEVFWSNPTTPLLLAQVQRNQWEGTGC